MDALAELLVATFLTRGGAVFIAPQYAIPSDNPNKDWSCPDFVALDFGKREVVVVEVSTASNIVKLLNKVDDRKLQWFDRLRTKMVADRVDVAGWPMRFLGFIRRDNVEEAKSRFSGQPDVTFCALEDATFDWEYWKRRTGGVP